MWYGLACVWAHIRASGGLHVCVVGCAQVNPDAVTIESTLEAATVRAGGISADNAGDLKKVGWARTARTDKGVHAAGNVVCFKLLMREQIIDKASTSRIFLV